MNDVRVRIAPSPTGFLHIGTAQSALYNWLFARKNGGKFFLRIEDTDQERSTKAYEKSIIESLSWLGLEWDGEIIRQSDRNEKYREALEKLKKAGKVQHKIFSAEEKAAMLKDGKKSSKEIYILPIDPSPTAKPVAFTDMIRGLISVEQKNIGNLVIARVPEENPDDVIFLYNFVVVVDDLDMGITDVIRGEDHISNTPKQLLIYKALGGKPPQFAHLPLLLAPDRSKLSKRHGATAVVDYKEDYLPEAIINFLGKLSYTFSSDIIDRDAMVREFELSKVHHSGAVFDVKKLDWLNGEYIKKLSDKDLSDKLQPYTGNASSDYVAKILPLARERIKKFSDIKEFNFFFEEPEYDKELLAWKFKSDKEMGASLQATKELLEKFDWVKSNVEKLRKELDALSSQIGDRGLIYWPFRVALTGQKSSPDPVDVAEILGKEKTLERIEVAISKIR